MSLKPSLKWCMWNGCPFAASIMFHVSNGVDLFWKGKGLCKWTKRHALVRWINQHSEQDWHVLNRLKLTLHTSYSLKKKVCRLARQNTSRYMSSDTVSHSAAVHKQSQFDFMSSVTLILKILNLGLFAFSVVLFFNFRLTVRFMMMHHYCKFDYKQFSSSKDIIWRNIHWNVEPLIWPWQWRRQSNLFAFRLWGLNPKLNLLAKVSRKTVIFWLYEPLLSPWPWRWQTFFCFSV